MARSLPHFAPDYLAGGTARKRTARRMSRVRGDALSLVIIDKLPFTSPDDPLLKARMEDCRLRGGDPFDEVQLPDAVITLKQGVGRLIRDIDDRGVLVICDNRLVMRPYGAVFLASLPPAPRTRDIRRAVRFLAVPSAR